MEPKSPHFWGWWAEVQTHHHWILLNPSLHEWTHLSRHKIVFVGLCIFASLAVWIMCHVYNGLKGKKIKPGKMTAFISSKFFLHYTLLSIVCVFSSPLHKEWRHLLQQTDWTSQPTLCITHGTPPPRPRWPTAASPSSRRWQPDQATRLPFSMPCVSRQTIVKSSENLSSWQNSVLNLKLELRGTNNGSDKVITKAAAVTFGSSDGEMCRSAAVSWEVYCSTLCCRSCSVSGFSQQNFNSSILGL